MDANWIKWGGFPIQISEQEMADMLVLRVGHKVKATFWKLQSTPKAGVVIERKRVILGRGAEIVVRVRWSDGTEVEASNSLFTLISEKEYVALCLMNSK